MSKFILLSALVVCVSAGTNAEGLKFLEENKGKEGVITIGSGLQYKVLTKGSGVHHPLADSSCSCHYKGTLINGDQFDSSYDRGTPTDFAPNQVIT
jgi:FKBP-type peptidyl-prolyl cis-trans isomerase FklB